MRLILGVAALTFMALASSAQEQQEKAKVEITLAAQHVPEALKAGARANLQMILSSRIAPNGMVSLRTAPLAFGAEVVSVKRLKKPADPLKAVQVELRVMKEEAVRIEKIKMRTVKVVERKNGNVIRAERPIPLRLELVKE